MPGSGVVLITTESNSSSVRGTTEDGLASRPGQTTHIRLKAHRGPIILAYSEKKY